METTILGKHKKRLWCLLDARKVAAEAGDVSCPMPLINRLKDPPVVGHRGRRDRMVLQGLRRAGRRGRRGLRDHQDRRGFMVVVRRALRDRLVLPVRGRRGRRDRRDHQGRRGFMVGVRQGLRDRLALPVRARRGRREGDLRGLQDNRNLGRPLDGYARGAVVTRASVLAGITRSR